MKIIVPAMAVVLFESSIIVAIWVFSIFLFAPRSASASEPLIRFSIDHNEPEGTGGTISLFVSSNGVWIALGVFVFIAILTALGRREFDSKINEEINDAD